MLLTTLLLSLSPSLFVSLHVILFLSPHLQRVFLLVAARLHDVVPRVGQLVYGVLVSDDVDVEGPLDLHLGHGHVGLQAEGPQGDQLTLRLSQPGQLGVNGLLILNTPGDNRQRSVSGPGYFQCEVLTL